MLGRTVLSGSRSSGVGERIGFAVYTFLRTNSCGFQPKAMTAILTISPTAHADMIGAAAGAGTGLVAAGPVGALAGLSGGPSDGARRMLGG